MQYYSTIRIMFTIKPILQISFHKIIEKYIKALFCLYKHLPVKSEILI